MVMPMTEKALTWFARIWLGTLMLVNIVLAFFLPNAHDTAFHIGWVPIVPVPDLPGVVWWTADAAAALPAIGALFLRDQIRRKKASGGN